MTDHIIYYGIFMIALHAFFTWYPEAVRYSEPTATFGSTPFGQGGGHIWLNGLECTGNENSLLECSGADPSAGTPNQCDHFRDAGVKCFGGK